MKTGKAILPGNTEKFIDAQTGKRIHEHLNNKNDIITEEDISNVRTDIGISGNEVKRIIDKADAAPAEKNEDKVDREDQKIKDNSNPSVDTTWNILEE